MAFGEEEDKDFEGKEETTEEEVRKSDKSIKLARVMITSQGAYNNDRR